MAWFQRGLLSNIAVGFAGATFAIAALNGPAASSPTHLPPVDLRGYGRLSGTYDTPADSPGSSVLCIQADDEAKARLVLAKYVSDLTSLPGVRDSAVPGCPALVAHSIAGQGVVLAARDHAQVYVIAAPNIQALSKLAASSLPATAVSEPGADVPMYLDRWDKFGFRFYYRPWEQPANQPKDAPYDVATEFEWAQKMGRSGFVFWDDMHAFSTAEGMNNEVWWDWAQNSARKRSLPVAINDSLSNSVNKYEGQQELKMPQYAGTFYEPGAQNVGGEGLLSWNATTAADDSLAIAQTTIRDFASAPNVVSWLEPHGELNHGAQTVFMEYGPAADDGFRRYLRETFKTPAAVGERWFDDPKRYASWDQIRVPELASFLNWGPQAIDLTGPWKIAYEDLAPNSARQDFGHNDDRPFKNAVPAPDDWFAPSFNDAAWPSIVTPGNDAVLFLPKRPAVFRRTFDIPASWLAANKSAWLYVWDLNKGNGDLVRTVVNGKEIPSPAVRFNTPHWMAVDISSAITTGSNLVALRLPKGFIGYRCYIAHEAPLQYPNLGLQGNARWVDFALWQRWCRVNMVRRGIEMIRQVDPDRQITQMHPDEYADEIKPLMEQFGAEFHNTGYMGGFYADLDPLLMQGSNLPSSLEPGGPAKTLAEYKKQMGLWYSEGVQSVDYFIHIGDILWNDDIRAYFEKTQNQVHMFGKYHAASAQVAELISFAANTVVSYPWGSDPNNIIGTGYWACNPAGYLVDRCDRDAITERDFASGLASKYRVLIDSNTSIMDDDLLAQIEKYVRDGGIFITFAQTGRHSLLQKDTWPISRLTGYTVTHIDKLSPSGDPVETRLLAAAPGQSIFDDKAMASLNIARANGLSLKPSAPDVHNVLLWQDGSVALGYRQIGKGMIVNVGCKWTGSSLFDRIEPGGYGFSSNKALMALFSSLLDWLKVPAIPGRVDGDTKDILLRRWVSNNSLYDVWTAWNQNQNSAHTVDIAFDNSIAATSAIDVDSGQSQPLSGDGGTKRLTDISFEPGQTRIFLTPRETTAAALDWFALQRSWWRGTAKPTMAPLPEPLHPNTLDITRDWSWKPLTDTDDAQSLASSTAQDKSWERMRLGIWSQPDHPAIKHAVFQKIFTVPAAWKSGRTSIWLTSWFSTTFLDRGRIWLDGKLLRDWSADGIAGEDAGGVLKAGSTHTLTVEATATGSLAGLRGECWLSYKPDPIASIDLAGDWTPSKDFLVYGDPIDIPGPFKEAVSFRRKVDVPASFAGKTVMFYTDAPNPMLGILVNGHWVRRHHHMIGDRWSLDITPWIKPGAANEIEFCASGGSTHGRVRAVALEAYPASPF